MDFEQKYQKDPGMNRVNTYRTYIQEAFKVFEWLSMTFLALFLKAETLVMENYCPI